MIASLAAALYSTLALAPALAGDGVKTPKLELGLRLVLRPEARANATFASATTDDEWRVLQGARISAKGTWGPAIIVVQLQDVRAWGQETSTLSVDPQTGLHQGYLELRRRGRTKLMLRLGRQEIVLWSGRLLGNAPWQPANRAFDGVRGRLERGRLHVEAMAILLGAPGSIATGEDEAGATQAVRTSGDQIYAAVAGVDVVPSFAIDVGGLARRAGPTDDDPARDRAFAGPGLQLRGSPTRGLDYAIEGWLQAGRDADRRHLAWMTAATVGYAFDVRAKPALRATHEIASGDACRQSPAAGAGCGAPRRADFDQLFGTRHAYRGYADVLALVGGGDASGRLSLTPHPSTTLSIDYHWMYLYAPSGRWLDASGRPIGDGWTLDDPRRGLAHEIDLMVSWKPWTPLDVRPGYSLVIPTRAGARIAGPEPLHFVYLWLIAEF